MLRRIFCLLPFASKLLAKDAFSLKKIDPTNPPQGRAGLNFLPDFGSFSFSMLAENPFAARLAIGQKMQLRYTAGAIYCGTISKIDNPAVGAHGLIDVYVKIEEIRRHGYSDIESVSKINAPASSKFLPLR